MTPTQKGPDMAKQVTVWINGRMYVGNPATGRYREVKP